MEREIKPWIGYSYEGTRSKTEDIEFFDIRNEPFKIYGLHSPKTSFHRMPDDVASKVSAGVADKNRASAGARVRFATDSDIVAVRIKTENDYFGEPHVTMLACRGADMYVEEGGRDVYYISFKPPVDKRDGYDTERSFPTKEMREITVNLPIALEVYSFEIGLRKGSVLKEHRPYKYEKPVVFYGSSITQGFAASRPGTIYEQWISREYDTNFINLGFSGQCRAELAMADYLIGLDMTALVFDYDHNAPDAEYLAATHERFFNKIREARPELPIILVSMPNADLSDDCVKRRTVIMRTFANAVDKGDKNVYFLDGFSLFGGKNRDEYMVDGTHPTDVGFKLMGDVIGNTLFSILKKL